MDYQQLANEVVLALIPLTPYAVKTGETIAEKIGESIFDGGKQLYSLIRSRFQKEPDNALQVIELFEENPKRYTRTMEDVLVDIFEGDPKFVTEVQANVQSKATIKLIAVGKSFIQRNEIKTRGNVSIEAYDESIVSDNKIGM